MKRKHIPLSLVRIISRGMALLAVLLLALLYPLAQEGIAKPLTVTIVHTNNVTGHLFACPS